MFFATLFLTLGAELKEAPRPLRPAEGGIGRMVADVEFRDTAGLTSKLSAVSRGPFLVIAGTSDSCPICQKFTPTLMKLESEYTPRGVTFLFVNPTKTDTPKPRFTGRYVHDSAFAAAIGLTTTTEVVVLDAARTVVFRGAIDDQYGLGYSLAAPRNSYLKPALEALLAGKVPDFQATTAPGCQLEHPAAVSAPVTYHQQISRIVQSHCQECHRKGGVAPFTLESYDDLKAHQGMIRKVVAAGTMPPWFAAAPAEGSHSPFVNDCSLAPADKRQLLDWFKSEMPRGQVTDAPLAKTWPSGWRIGKPDVVFEIPKPIKVAATGTMPYQTVSVETKLEEDKWVQGYEIQPSAKAVVHHVLVHVIPKSGGLFRNFPGARTGISTNTDDDRQGYFAAYVPGNSSSVLPEGYARKLPSGCTLRFQIHYTPNGTATEDRTKVGMVFAKKPPQFEVKVSAVAQPRIQIPPGAENHKEVGKLRLPADVTLRSFVPHMHVRAKACRYELQSGETTTTLLDVPRYDFNWQLRYLLAEPLTAPKGSTLTFTVWYDNSTKNPANPDATQTVRWGPQTSDEMHLGYLEYIIDRSKSGSVDLSTVADEKPVVPETGYPIPEQFGRAMKPYDTNGDGKLDAKEIDAMPPAVKERVQAYIQRNKP